MKTQQIYSRRMMGHICSIVGKIQSCIEYSTTYPLFDLVMLLFSVIMKMVDYVGSNTVLDEFPPFCFCRGNNISMINLCKISQQP